MNAGLDDGRCTDKVNDVNCACPERFSGHCLEIGIVLIDVCVYGLMNKQWCHARCDGIEEK